jgi:hypothetical protein
VILSKGLQLDLMFRILPNHLLARWFLSLLILDPEDGSDTLLRNVGSYTDYTALYPTRLELYVCVESAVGAKIAP